MSANAPKVIAQGPSSRKVKELLSSPSRFSWPVVLGPGSSTLSSTAGAISGEGSEGGDASDEDGDGGSGGSGDGGGDEGGLDG